MQTIEKFKTCLSTSWNILAILFDVDSFSEVFIFYEIWSSFLFFSQLWRFTYFFLDLFPDILEFITFLNLKITKIDDDFEWHENANSERSQVRGPEISGGGDVTAGGTHRPVETHGFLGLSRMSRRHVGTDDVIVY